MENSLFVLLGFAEAAEKYMQKNGGKALDGLANVDLSNLKKSLIDSIDSFDVNKDPQSELLGELVFKQFVNESNKPKKKNVIDELGQIFDVDLESEFSIEKQTKLKIDDLLAGYETEYEDETSNEVEETPIEDVSEEAPELEIQDYEELINNIIGISEEYVKEEDVTDVFYQTKPIEEEVEEEVEEEPEIKEEVFTAPDIDVSEVVIQITGENIGQFSAVEEDYDANKEVVDEVKDIFENIDVNEEVTQEPIVIEEAKEENDFGLDENDEILKAIRKAAGFDNEEENETAPLFQPAPDELDSIFEEVETNPVEDLSDEEENDNSTNEVVEPMSQEDLLKSLSGLVNYGQFDILDSSDEQDSVQEEEKEYEESRSAQYIVNPLVDEQEKQFIDEDITYVVSDEVDDNEETINQTDLSDLVNKDYEQFETPSEEFVYHFIENPGLDVMFDGDDISFSSYDEQVQDVSDEAETEEVVDEEEVSEEVEIVEEVKEDLRDENEKYVDGLLNNYDFVNNKVNEILDAREEVYKVISKMYPNLNYAFIKSAYDLKDSIAEEYPEDLKIIILHRATFKEVEDLRKYAEVMMNHNYQVNVDETQMMVDTLKSYKNVDGLILNSIFEVSNQVHLINGVYEGYCVLTNDEE